MQMNDKTVLITGSTDGVGRYVARRLAAECAKVLIHGPRCGARKDADRRDRESRSCRADLLSGGPVVDVGHARTRGSRET
ncbi:hypothetical protein BRDID11002_10050 [Bradyrhizobium diazoefficiens]